MKPVSELRRREVETYFSVIADGVSERQLEARAFHNLGEYEHDDFASLSELLVDVGATAGFAFLGRDADEQAGSIERVHADGHEVVLHGYRHVACGDLSYGTAHENLARGIDAIEDATGLTPTGFFAPLQEMSPGTVRAIDELGFEWALGRSDVDAETATLVEPVNPYDIRLLGEGLSPAETFDRLAERTEDGACHLVHPNVLVHYDATAEFEEWVRDVRPVSVGEGLSEGGVGLVLDCVRPLKIE